MHNHQDQLTTKINDISKTFEIKNVLATNTDVSSVAKYYKINRLAYSLFHNKDDFVHMGISRDGHYKKEDLLEQAKIIDIYLTKLKTGNVLELATGRGATSAYLAQKYPAITFEGLDLPNGQLDYAKAKTKHFQNFHVSEGDYHDLTKYQKNTFDIVFIIEALCHSDNKAKVIKEVARILKKNGIFIIIDGFSGKPVAKLSKDELLCKELIEKGMRVAGFENYQDIENMLEKNGFTISFQEDISAFILPTLKRFETQAKYLLSLPRLIAKSILALFPSEFTYNAISGYLMPIAIERAIAKYIIVVATKKR